MNMNMSMDMSEHSARFGSFGSASGVLRASRARSSPPTVTGHAFHTCETNLPWHNLISFPLSSPPRALLSSPRIYSQTPRAESGSLGFVIISKGRVRLSLRFLLAPEGRVQLSSFFSLPRAESGSPKVFFSDRGPGSALLGFLLFF